MAVVMTLAVALLFAAGLPGGPRRRGARALGYLAKTDALDAQALAELAATMFCSARLWVPLPPAIVALLLDAQSRELADRCRALVASDATLRSRVARLCAVPGVGWKTSLGLLAWLPELGRANRRQIAALAGLAPRDHQSGGRDGRRFVSGGRARARAALFMATLSALQHNPRIRAAYARLRARDAPAMRAVVACMRRLLVALHGRLRCPAP